MASFSVKSAVRVAQGNAVAGAASHAQLAHSDRNAEASRVHFKDELLLPVLWQQVRSLSGGARISRPHACNYFGNPQDPRQHTDHFCSLLTGHHGVQEATSGSWSGLSEPG